MFVMILLAGRHAAAGAKQCCRATGQGRRKNPISRVELAKKLFHYAFILVM
jgi:hypothetical protein